MQLFTEARGRTEIWQAAAPAPVRVALPILSGFSALAWMMQRRRQELSRGYFPREVFFSGLGFLVLLVLSGAASFFGRSSTAVWKACLWMSIAAYNITDPLVDTEARSS